MKVITLLVAVTAAAGPMGGEAHDAASGWTYDISCCSSIDCRQIPSTAVRELPSGYFIAIGNQTVPYGDRRIKDSPDGFVHWCTVNGRNDGRTICLYMPPRAY